MLPYRVYRLPYASCQGNPQPYFFIYEILKAINISRRSSQFPRPCEYIGFSSSVFGKGGYVLITHNINNQKIRQ